jgi:bacterial/archaeal transporter family-2 protein
VSTAVRQRPRGATLLASHPRLALIATIAAGGAIAVQSYLNGRLGRQLGSPELSAAINNLVATALMLAVVLATGALPRALARLRALGRPPVWHFLGGLGGAALVLVSAFGAPEVGVALLMVAIVSGSTFGSLPVDAFGIGPAGRRPVTAPRVAGVLLAIAATVVSAIGARGHPDALLLSLAVGAGVLMALQAAANGQLARETAEPFVASLVNVLVGFTALGTVAFVAVASAGIDSFPTNPVAYVGGLLGATVVFVTATAVQSLGVLRLGLAMVAGQMSGALIVDLIAPARGEAVTPTTVLGVILTMIAVSVSGRGQAVAAAR